MASLCFAVLSILVFSILLSYLIESCKAAESLHACVCRNADVSNTFKVDLHALHVDEALYEVERTIKALSPFKCECCSHLHKELCVVHNVQ